MNKARPITVCMALLVLLGPLGGTQADAPLKSPADEVNVYIGTGGGGTEYGGTMPFVEPPFAMTSWTPQTRQSQVSRTSYAWEDTTISGFIGTHQPAIWMGDYGYVTLMPEIDAVKTTPDARKLPFTRAEETATPYRYAISMDAGAARTLKTEMTATDHCALLRFTYPQNDHASVLVEATRPGVSGLVQIDAKAQEISGFNPDRQDHNLGPLKLPNFKGYFVVQFQKPFAQSGTYQGMAIRDGNALAVGVHPLALGENVGGYAAFRTTQGEAVEVKVGTSFISIEQARANLKKEIPGWDFAAQTAALKAIWNRKLGIATLEGATDDQRKIFYTGLYHGLLYPRQFSEGGRYYSAFDDAVHTGVSYTDYSLWDTFRAENSLITLFVPERVDGMVQALLQDYQEGGWMPKWPNPSYTNIMIGTHADSVVAEAVNKGFHGFDYGLAYRAVYQDAMVPPIDDTKHWYGDREAHTPYEARNGLTYSLTLGYIPVDKSAEAASSTLEDAYDDWCVAQVAKAVGKTDDYQLFLKRSQNYRNLYNPATGFMQGKKADGTWADPGVGWTESDKWAYTWCVMQDIPGLIDLMGGPDAFNAKLDEHFAGGHNHHDNEPCHHYGYLYDYSGQPWKTQTKVREIAAKFYKNVPDGIDGNDDCGQMSAWYLFTALGFYPVNPASAEYTIGSPLFGQITLHLPNGRVFVIQAVNNSEANVYIQSATLNGKPLARPAIRHADILKGGTLRFVMGPMPSTWGSGAKTFKEKAP